MLEKQPPHHISFKGDTMQLVGIVFLNLLLVVITLGMYYPWYRAKLLKYIYSETYFNEDNFQFVGTGRELFIGLLKALVLVGIIYGPYLYGLKLGDPEVLLMGFPILLIGSMIFIPLAVHGAFRYRMSRTVLRGIHFRYTGSLKKLYGIYIKGFLLTILTLGVYSVWNRINVRKYVLSNVRYGNVTFGFNGTGWQYFSLLILGYLLTIMTLGIYGIWWYRSLHNYYIDNLQIEQDGRAVYFKSNLTAWQVIQLGFVTLLGFITLGIALPWSILTQYRILLGSIEIHGNIDLEAIEQSNDTNSGAMGEDMADMMDIGMV